MSVGILLASRTGIGFFPAPFCCDGVGEVVGTLSSFFRAAIATFYRKTSTK
jgi:hypothetical protein